MRKRGKLRRWEVEKLGKKQDFRMGSLEGGSRTRRRPKGQDFGAARCGRGNLSIADFRFGIVECGRCERKKLRRWEVEKLGKKQDFRMGSLEGGSRTRRRPKGQDFGAARCGRGNLSIADFRFGIVECGRCERKKLRRWEDEKVGKKKVGRWNE